MKAAESMPMPLAREQDRPIANDPEADPGAAAAALHFSRKTTPEILALIDPGDPDDPIRRQYLPSARELVVAPEELADPIGDDAYSPIKGIVHRHADRVLLKPTLACAVHCRFCFRRDVLDEAGGGLNEAELEAALEYVRRQGTVKEVILTGGDPLVLVPPKLARIVRALSAVPHLTTIRVHTRVPVAATRLAGDELIAALATPKAMFVVVHCNHARELTDAARAACARFVAAGIPVLSQSVLLAGVNDTVDALADLMEGLVAIRVKPYYLHQCDLVRGTSHFRVEIERGRELVAALRQRVSGIAMPTYVLDVPGGFGKVPLGPDYGPDADGAVRDPAGRMHPYPRSRP